MSLTTHIDTWPTIQDPDTQDFQDNTLLDKIFPTHSLTSIQSQEKDPHGKDPHQTGAKLDSGKNRPGLVLGGFARALWAVSEIGTFGALKYTDNGWMDVPNGAQRYEDAQMRHWLKAKMGQILDPDSMKTHLAHEAWNALARLDLYLRDQENKRDAA